MRSEEEIAQLLDELILLQGDSIEGYISAVNAMVEHDATPDELDMLDAIARKRGIEV